MNMITVEYMRYGVVDYQSTYSLLAGDLVRVPVVISNGIRAATARR